MKTALLALSIASLASLTGCAVQGATTPVAAAPAPAKPAVLTQSLFSKDPSGAIGESDLQTVLASPIDLQFPARIGVVPLGKPFDPGGEVPIATRGIAS